LILLLQFFLNVSLAGAGEPLDLGVTAAVTQLATIATPALLMAVMLTRDPARTLLVRGTTGRAVAAAALLAVLVHPAATWLGIAVQQLYPVSDELKGALAGMFRPDTSLVELFLAAALLPAVCEELAFRGFILSGLRHLGHKWRAIALCSILFGVAHGVVQQSIVAAAAGVLLGYVAVQTGSLWPCIAFHAVHNSLGLAAMRVAELGSPELLAGWLYESTPDGIIRYTWPVVAAAAFCAWLVAGWFKRLPYARTDEERMQEAIQRRAASESVRAARPRALAGRGD
jgi:sodium transport system permease protein